MGGGNVSQDQTSIICIDLKSFYASVECVERGLNPFKTNLVVADPTRSKSTICLAITPAMKSLGIKNRCRIHEIPDCVKYITAMPRMQLYMDYSAKIYGIYLRYVSKEDIHVYSVDECFIDVTNYLQLYHLTAKEMAVKLMQAVMEETGITATAGVGTNLYLAKIAMDIVAKHVDDHIGILNEFSYREQLWDHKPLSDFWRIGSRTEKKLAGYGIHTMGDIAMASLRSEDWLYKMFGIDAELLIDHAWGYETFNKEFFDNENWYIRLLMEAEDRMTYSQSKISTNHGVFSNSDVTDDAEIMRGSSKDFVDDVIDREILHALIKELTERQKMVLNLVYFEEMRQQDVADYLGIKQQSVNDLLNRALKTMKKKAENEEF
ncbi:sigma-70 family RNA polymerase sigma factor [Dorea formicigenerans]|uniref:sigma-70 family RNA polymerase sigma factor n=1 Tax=Dorea formicigenerans TaxID=39486 RepID=UPI003A8A3ECF